MSPRPLPLDADEIVAAYQSGDSVKTIAHRLGVAEVTVRRRLVDRGVMIRGPRGADPLPLDDDAIVAAYVATGSTAAVAQQFGVAIPTIRRRLTGRGFDVSADRRDAVTQMRVRTNARTDIPSDDLIARYRDGWTVQRIARHYDASHTLVSKRLRQLGILGPPRRHQRRRPSGQHTYTVTVVVTVRADSPVHAREQTRERLSWAGLAPLECEVSTTP